MARRPAPPSSSSAVDDAAAGHRERARRRPRGQRTVDVRAWAGGIRLSGFAAIMLSLVVLGTWVLVPSIGTYLEQRQRIAALEESVQVTEEQIADLQRQQVRWDDPAYITTEARERLYYVKPGQVPYLVDDDLDPADLPPAPQEISEQITERPSDWMPQLLRSLTAAGMAKTAEPAG